MSEQFQPGDTVECVNDEPPEFPTGAPVPPRGTLCQVVGIAIVEDGTQALIVASWPNINDEPCRGWQGAIIGVGVDLGWIATRFRKVYRPDPKFIERLTAEPVIMPPVRHPERVDA